MFEEGLKATRNASQLLGNYANFLNKQRKDDERAEEYYLKAIATDPNHANYLGNYAVFLETQRKTTSGRRSITSRPRRRPQ